MRNFIIVKKEKVVKTIELMYNNTIINVFYKGGNPYE